MEIRQQVETAGRDVGRQVARYILYGCLCIVAAGLLLATWLLHQTGGHYIGFFAAGILAALAWVVLAVIIGVRHLRRLVERLVDGKAAESAMETYIRMSRRDRQSTPAKGK